MQIEISEYLEKDLDDLMQMAIGLIDLMSSIDPQKRFRPKEDFDAVKYVEARFQKILDENGKVYIAFADEKPAGYLMATIEGATGVDSLNKYPTKLGVIDALFVLESFRGEGISSAVLEKSEAYFRDNGCDFSEISCLATNEPARSAYLKKGYEERYIDFQKRL
jgi:GNAT superfamily N-acetyltransferase